MSKLFTRTYLAGYSEINANGLLDPAQYARYIIDTAYEWGEIMGLGDRVSEQLGLYWVIRETEIHFFGSLRFMDEFNFSIWLLNWKRVRGTRAFEVKRKSNGEMIAQGVQQIACLDKKTRRPISPPMHLIDNFLLNAEREIPAQRFPKIPAAPERSLTVQIKAAWPDVDILEMVNNAVYIGYAEEAAARLFTASGWSHEEFKKHGLALVIHRLHIQYQIPAVWGDTLNTTIFSLEMDKMGGTFCVRMERALDGTLIACCILDWGLIDRGSSEAHPLPESLSTVLKESLVL